MVFFYFLGLVFGQGARARALYKSGLRTPQALVEVSLPELVKALFEASSWAAEGKLGGKKEISFYLGQSQGIYIEGSFACFMPRFH